MRKLMILGVMTAMLSFLACGPSAEEISSKEKATNDSIAASNTPTTTEIADQPADQEQSPAAEEASGGAKKAGKAQDDADKNEEAKNKVERRPEQKTFYDSVYVAINSNRKLIKTANLVFSVKDVEKATLQIERIAYSYGGFTLNSGITKNVIEANTIRINSDTVLEVGSYKIQNNITLRVPHFLLDSALLKFAGLWIELDERTIKAEDVTIDYLANDLRAKIHQKTANNINRVVQNQSNRLDDVVEAEKTANQYLETSIQKQVENLTLQDRVDYATITMNIYQDEVFYKKKIASYELSDYEPGFGSELVDSLSYGWSIILNFILFLAKGWSVMLISLIIFLFIYYMIRFIIRKKRSKKAGDLPTA
jgi:hypothetical protein